jgi:cytochrome b561
VEHYDAGAIAFHWATFVLVVVVGVLGLLHDWRSDQTQTFWINVRAVIGLFMWTLVLARVWWRVRHEPLARRENVGLLLITPIIGIIAFTTGVFLISGF